MADLDILMLLVTLLMGKEYISIGVEIGNPSLRYIYSDKSGKDNASRY